MFRVSSSNIILACIVALALHVAQVSAFAPTSTLLTTSHRRLCEPFFIRPLAGFRETHESLRGGAVILADSASSPEAAVPTTVPRPPIDAKALVRYTVAITMQWVTIMAVLLGLQSQALTRMPAAAAKATVFATFAFLALKSRKFSLLNNSRPKLKGEKGAKMERRRPDWMTGSPTVMFPIIWSTIALLRATSSTMIWQTMGGKLFTAPIGAMILHLCVGDTWNTINNVEQRLGAAVPGVFLVWVTVVNACYQYYKTLPAAGLVLLPSAMWITVANFLVQAIWRLNGKEPLYPYVQTP